VNAKMAQLNIRCLSLTDATSPSERSIRPDPSVGCGATSRSGLHRSGLCPDDATGMMEASADTCRREAGPSPVLAEFDGPPAAHSALNLQRSGVPFSVRSAEWSRCAIEWHSTSLPDGSV
jgi:hypothetical protein